MKRILIIQIYRFGDVLQTTPAIRGLRAAAPDAYIAALVRPEFGAPLQHNPDLNEIIFWDVDGLVARALDPDAPLEENCRALARFVAQLRSRRFNLILNLSNGTLSALLVAMLRETASSGPVDCRGLRLSPDRRMVIEGDWARYLFLATSNRAMNVLNMADMLAGICGAAATPRRASFPTARDDDAFAVDFLETEGVRPKPGLLVGIQPGASKPFRRWPPGRFAVIADWIVQGVGGSVIFFGADADRAVGQQVLDRMKHSRTCQGDPRATGPRVVSAIGRTSPHQLAALVRRCDVLLSNDTATAHVAAAVGTPALVLTFGTGFSYENAPYADSCYVLEPRMPCLPCSPLRPCPSLACRDAVSVQTVRCALEIVLEAEGIHSCEGPSTSEMPAGQSVSDEVALYRTRFDEAGFLELVPVNRPTLTGRDLLRAAYRTYWLSVLCGGSVPRSDAGALLQQLLTTHGEADTEALANEMRQASEGFAQVMALAEAGKRAATSLRWHTYQALAAAREGAGGRGARRAGLPAARTFDGGVARLARAIDRLDDRIRESADIGSREAGRTLPMRFLASAFVQGLDQIPPFFPGTHRPGTMQAASSRIDLYGTLAAGCEFMRRATADLAAELAGAAVGSGLTSEGL